jgi:hypothetical protein
MIGWWLRDAVAFHKLDIIAHTHTTRIITHTHITTLTTILISVIGGNKWLACQFNQPLWLTSGNPLGLGYAVMTV